MNLADNLKRIRKDNNLSQEQLAEKLGVSRQAVSKWESGQSYPEMDKVIQICQLFNLNINELINEDIKEINEKKAAEGRTNKYISSFFDYITKVVDMFCSMSFKEKAKCLFEQFIVCLFILIIALIIGTIGSEIIHSILQILPYNAYYFIYSILETIYFLIVFIVGTAVFLHIFKIRYLDYYEVVKEDTLVEEVVTEVEAVNVEDEKDKKNKVVLEKKTEKVVIRDPKHSEYKFLSGLGKMILWFIKFITCFILMAFATTLVALVICVPVIFLVYESGLLFVSLMMCLGGAILLNIVVLEILYNFIANRNFNKLKIFLVSIVSLIILGVGVGCMAISVTQFEIVENEHGYEKFLHTYDMKDSLRIGSSYYYDIEYIEKDIDNVEVVYELPEYHEVYFFDHVIGADYYFDETKIKDLIEQVIDDINDKKVVTYAWKSKLYVYGNKENLEIIKNNTTKYNDDLAMCQSNLEAVVNRFED